MKDPTAPEIKPIEPKPVTINAEKSALLVLELSEWCADPEYMAAPLVPGVTRLLERARTAGILIAFTIPERWKGKHTVRCIPALREGHPSLSFSLIGSISFTMDNYKAC